MKKSKNIYCILLFAVLGITGCSEEKMAPLPEPVPLRMSINSTDLVMGETLEITFDVTGTDEGMKAMNEDVSIKLSATTEKGAVDRLLFEGFPTEVVMKQGETSKTIPVLVKEGLNKEYSVEISAFARGYRVENALQLLTVSDYHYSRVMIKNNADNTVKEGQSFILTASVNSKLKDDLIIVITPAEGVARRLENLPEHLVIPAGESSVESEAIMMIKSTETIADEDLKLTFSTIPVASRYPLVANEIIIHRIDIHKGMDTKIRDERWLYEDADQLFVSPQNEDAVKKWGQLNYVVMKEGDPHPNSGNVLPDGKWKFFRAYAFHKIDACLTTKDSPMGDYVSKEYPFGFADQNTAAVESQGAVDNAKYAYVMDEGYLRMMTLKERAKSGNGGKEKRLKSYLGTQIDTINIANAYRMIHFFNADQQTVKSRMIPVYLKIPERKMDELYSAQNDQEFLKTLAAGYYGREMAEQGIDMAEPDTALARLRFKQTKRAFSSARSAPECFFTFNSLAEVEVKNIIRIIEGIRYDLPAKEISELLIT